MHVGKLDKLVQLQKRTLDQDPSGQPKNTYETVALMYACVEPVVGSAYLAAQQLNVETTHDITIAYRRFVFPGDMRILWSGRYFEILASLDPKEQRKWLYLKCKEVFEA
jgi:SPP1 family predicted phage head-tail adaptor